MGVLCVFVYGISQNAARNSSNVWSSFGSWIWTLHLPVTLFTGKCAKNNTPRSLDYTLNLSDYYEVIYRQCNLSKNHSFFLFGSRGVGKSTLIRATFRADEMTVFDLLNPQLETELALNPNHLAEKLELVQKTQPEKKWVFIDEVQKIPTLLDVVHSLIEQKHFLFALSGSSARKLKRGNANLLAGRAYVFHLFPFTHHELGADFKLDEVLRWGSLPKVYESDDLNRIRYLRSYANTYLKEEIVAEQLVRNLVPFRAFLEVAAQSAGKIINYSNIARDVNVETPTVQSYFDILEETYIGFKLNPFHESLRKRQRQNPKFYFFDNGVLRTLARRVDLPISESTFEYGDLFESFLIQEAFRLIHYQEKDWTLSYLATKDNFEVDLILDRPGMPRAFIEIKSSRSVKNESLTGLNRLRREYPQNEFYVLSQDKSEFIRDGISFLPWQKGFVQLGLR